MKNCDFTTTKVRAREWFDDLELIAVKGKTVLLYDGGDLFMCTARTFNLIKDTLAPIYTVSRTKENCETEVWIATLNIFG